MSDLDKAVEAVVRDCLGVRTGETVLVIANPGTEGIGTALRDEAESAGADAVLMIMAERDSHAAEPPAPVASAMNASHVVLAPTLQSLSHTASRRMASENGARIATLPGVTEEMLARVMSADMTELRRRANEIARRLTAGSEAHLRCPNGSDLRLNLGQRTAVPDGGELSGPNAFGNLPCGEGFVSPVIEGSEGTLVIDGTVAGVGRVVAPVTLGVSDGRLTAVDGPEAQALMDLLTPHGDDARCVAELGIGCNEKAQLTGNVLEDEKILGTAHVAFGASEAIGGTGQVPVQLDCVVLRPDVDVDGEPLVRDGQLVV
ncbi:MAG: aminopeptidase [Solirubrobacterales bacterium]